MSATILIRRATGSGPTYTDITSINTRANAYDTHSTADTSNGIQVPASGSNYSYGVWTRLDCSVAPTTGLNNIKWYTSGSNPFPSGVTCNAADVATYTQATGTIAVTGTSIGGSNAFAYTSSAPLSVSGSIGATTGNFGDFVAYQIVVASTVTSLGATAAATFSWQVDES